MIILTHCRQHETELQQRKREGAIHKVLQNILDRCKVYFIVFNDAVTAYLQSILHNIQVLDLHFSTTCHYINRLIIFETSYPYLENLSKQSPCGTNSGRIPFRV